MTRHFVLNTLKEQLESAGLNARVWGSDAPKAVESFLELVGGAETHRNKDGNSIEIVYQSSNNPFDVTTDSYPEDAQPLPFSLKPSRITANTTQVARITSQDGVVVSNWRGFADVRAQGRRVEQLSSVYAPLRDHIDLQTDITVSQKLEDGILLFYDSEPDNFCHFVLDWISSVGLISKSGIASRNLIIPRLAGYQFQEQILNLLAQAGFRVFFIDPMDAIEVTTIFHVMANRPLGSHPAFRCNIDAVQYLSALFKGDEQVAANRTPDQVQEILWIDRKLTRKIERSDDIVSALQSKYRVKRAMLEDLDLRAQLQLFSTSDFIVGVHGAGFTSLALLDSHKIKGVFEVFSPGNGTPTYRILANALNIRHGVYVGTRCETDHPNYPDISVDTEDFVASLVRFIQRPGS